MFDLKSKKQKISIFIPKERRGERERERVALADL